MKFVLFFLMVGLASCSVVGPGQRGIRISLGTVSEDPKPSGAYLWFPFVLGMKKINVQIQKSEIHSTAADEDDVEERILTPAVNEVLKAATAKRNAEEILTKRMEMKSDIDKGLQDRLSSYGIHLNDVSIVNLKYSDEFTKAIEQKQIAEQEAKQAVYVADKATQEAKAEVERSKGQAEAQKLLQSTMTPAILQKAAIDKWNGIFPTYMGGGALPFINLK